MNTSISHIAVAVLVVTSVVAIANAGLIAGESFDYTRRPCGYDQSYQPAGGSVAGLDGGFGWSGAWTDADTRYSGIATASLDFAGTTTFPPNSVGARTSPLAYTDLAGNALTTSGGQLRTSFGTSSTAARAMDLSGLPAEDLVGGKLGADGTSVWVRFLAQSHGATGTSGSTDRWAYVQLGNLRLGKLASSPTGNWGVEDAASGGQRAFGLVASDKATMILARIDFGAAADHVSVWLNPGLDVEPTSPAMQINVADLAFDSLRISARYSTDFDEVRLGTDFASVVPEPGTLGVLLVSGLLAMGRRRAV